MRVGRAPNLRLRRASNKRGSRSQSRSRDISQKTHGNVGKCITAAARRTSPQIATASIFLFDKRFLLWTIYNSQSRLNLSRGRQTPESNRILGTLKLANSHVNLRCCCHIFGSDMTRMHVGIGRHSSCDYCCKTASQYRSMWRLTI